MFNRFAICVLLAGVLFGTVAVAQSPAPSPKPGDHAYTEAAFDRYKQAEADYAAVAAQPDSSLRDLQLAYFKAEAALTAAYHALDDEAVQSRDVKDAKFAQEVAESTYERLKGKDLQTDHDIDKARTRARANYDHVLNARKEAIQSAIGMRLPWAVSRSARHYDLLEAERKANEEAAKKRFEAAKKAKAEAEKKAQPSPSPEPKKTSCAPGSGLGGAMENVACQEQHSGSTH
jgi:hypothetical protein